MDHFTGSPPRPSSRTRRRPPSAKLRPYRVLASWSVRLVGTEELALNRSRSALSRSRSALSPAWAQSNARVRAVEGGGPVCVFLVALLVFVSISTGHLSPVSRVAQRAANTARALSSRAQWPIPACCTDPGRSAGVCTPAAPLNLGQYGACANEPAIRACALCEFS